MIDKNKANEVIEQIVNLCGELKKMGVHYMFSCIDPDAKYGKGCLNANITTWIELTNMPFKDPETGPVMLAELKKLMQDENNKVVAKIDLNDSNSKDAKFEINNNDKNLAN